MSEQNIGACAILLNENGQVLLGKRKNSYKSGMYGLPGGRIEFKEKIDEAIVREVIEETGLKSLEIEFTGVVRDSQDKYEFIHFIFSAKVGNQEPQLVEKEKCEGWEWFDLDSDFSNVLAGHRAGIELYKSGQKLADLTE